MFYLSLYAQDITQETYKAFLDAQPVRHIHSDNYILFTEKDFQDVDSQGWKIYVSAEKNSMMKIASVVLPYLFEHKILCKIIGSLDLYEQFSESLWGKFIVIFTPGKMPNQEQDNHAAHIVKDLDALLFEAYCQPSDFRIPLYNQPVGKSFGLSVRYGCFFNKRYMRVVDEHGAKQKYYIEDNNRQAKPFFVTWDPFASIKTPT